MPLSQRSFAANAIRLQLHALAFNLGDFLRTPATREPIKDRSLTTLKENLIKIGAKVVSNTRHVAFQMARSGLVLVFVVNVLPPWGEYLLRLTPIDDKAKRTMPIVLAAVQGGHGNWAWPTLAAVYVMVVAPGVLGVTLAPKPFFELLFVGALQSLAVRRQRLVALTTPRILRLQFCSGKTPRYAMH